MSLQWKKHKEISIASGEYGQQVIQGATNAIHILQQAQIDVEEEYLSQEDADMYILNQNLDDDK